MADLVWGNLQFMVRPEPMRRSLWHVRQQIKWLFPETCTDRVSAPWYLTLKQLIYQLRSTCRLGAQWLAQSIISFWWRMWWKGRVILTEAFLLVRNYAFCPQSGQWPGRDSWHGQGLGMSRTGSLTSVIEMQEENCTHIKCKTILMQTGGAVARENKFIMELSVPCGLVARPAAESMIRLNVH